MAFQGDLPSEGAESPDHVDEARDHLEVRIEDVCAELETTLSLETGAFEDRKVEIQDMLLKKLAGENADAKKRKSQRQ